jgi:hypothetical protein
MATSLPPRRSQRPVQGDHACPRCGADSDGNWYERYGLVLDLVQVLPLTVQALALLLPHTSVVWPLSMLLLVIVTWGASRVARPPRRPHTPVGPPAPRSPTHHQTAPTGDGQAGNDDPAASPVDQQGT